MSLKGIFSPLEMSKLLLLASALHDDKDNAKFLEAAEKIFLNKLREDSELKHAVSLSPK